VIGASRSGRHGNVPLPQGQAKARAIEDMFDRIAPRYDLLNRVLTFRMDVAWRRAAVHALELVSGSVVLDLACGTGDVCRTIGAEGYRPVGVDFSAGMLARANGPAPLVRADAACLPFADGTFDGLTCGFALRNFVDLAVVLAECARVLRPRGRLALVDVSEPNSGPSRALHRLWFRRVVPFVGGVVSDRDAYAYLPASTAYLPTHTGLVELVGAAGFAEVLHRTLGAGAAQLITGTRR
jgi:demethylmenaquinone methyltransferase / 2-methoxy-6-polyprenyl-1,4-benzoquinol methylase